MEHGIEGIGRHCGVNFYSYGRAFSGSHRRKAENRAWLAIRLGVDDNPAVCTGRHAVHDNGVAFAQLLVRHGRVIGCGRHSFWLGGGGCLFHFWLWRRRGSLTATGSQREQQNQ